MTLRLSVVGLFRAAIQVGPAKIHQAYLYPQNQVIDVDMNYAWMSLVS